MLDIFDTDEDLDRCLHTLLLVCLLLVVTSHAVQVAL